MFNFCCSPKSSIIRYEHKKSFLCIGIQVSKLISCFFMKQTRPSTFYKNPSAVFLSFFMTFKLWGIFTLFWYEVLLKGQQCFKVCDVRARLITNVPAARGDSLIFKITEDNPL